MTTYVDRVRKKLVCTSTLSHLLIKLRAIKVYTLVSKDPLWADQIMSVPYASTVRSNISIQVWTCPNFDWDNWQIYKKVQKWTTEKAAKSLAYMQGNEVYMLTNKKSHNLHIVGYSDIVSARCVDIKVSTLSYIHTLAYGALSWKSSRMILLAIVMMQFIMWHVKRLKGRLYVKKFYSRNYGGRQHFKPPTAIWTRSFLCE